MDPEVPMQVTGGSQVEDPVAIYAKYPFDADPAYQQGVASLIAEGRIDWNAPEEQREEALRRTRVFYFNRMSGHTVTVEAVRNYEVSQKPEESPSTDAHAGTPSDDTRVLTFSELQELIETGKVDQIPNNKVIPNALNEAAPSVSTAAARKKPWE